MTKEEFQEWEKENPSKRKILLEDTKLMWKRLLENHKEEDIAFNMSHPDPSMRAITFGRVRNALDNENDICELLLFIHYPTVAYINESGLRSAEAEKSVKDEFEEYNNLIRQIIKKEANTFYNGMPNYTFINECRMAKLKALSYKYGVYLWLCCELVNWEVFEEEERRWLEMKKKMDDDSKNGASFPSFDPSITKRITEEIMKLKEMALGMALDEAGISKELLEKKD